MKESLTTIASTVLTQPPLSFATTVRKLDRMVIDPACAPNLVASILATDPMLSALVLSRANAAAPPGHPQISQISSAVIYLGMSMVQGLLGEVLPITARHRDVLASHWARANATGTMCQILARMCLRERLEHISLETLQLCGLVHDIGTLIAYVRFPEQTAAAAQLVANHNITFALALRRCLGLGPGGIGVLLARSWCLPPIFIDVLRHHERPHRAERHHDIVTLVHIARVMVAACGFTTPEAPYVEPLEDDCLDRLSLRSHDLESAVRDLFEELDELEMYEGALGRVAHDDAALTGGHPIIPG